MTDTVEYSGFQEIKCDHCGGPFSVKIDSWMNTVRQEVVYKAAVVPTMFECDHCGFVNYVRAVLKLELTVARNDKIRGSKKSDSVVVDFEDRS